MNLVSSSPAGALPEGCQDWGLLNDCHVSATTEEISCGKLVPVTLLERDLVIWRDTDGPVQVWEDLCIHRGARLSKGFNKGNKLVYLAGTTTAAPPNVSSCQRRPRTSQ